MDEAINRVGRSYFNYALNGILETDDTGTILLANPAAQSITGRRSRALHGCRLDQLITSPPEVLAHHLALLTEQGIQSSHLTIEDNGQTRLLQFESIDLGEGRWLHVFDDITEQYQLMDAVEQARQAAEQANAAKSLFLANIGHEIRTPLNGVIGLTQLALLTALTPQQETWLLSIRQSSIQLLGMLNDLLDFSKIEADRVAFETIPFSLDEVLDELAAPAAQAARGKPVELVLRLATDVPRLLVGDRLRLGQILTNILGNAIKFTASGTVALDVTLAAPVEPSHCRLQFTLWDTGIGMDEPAMAQLFRPFAQADASTSRRFGGTGLGLAITRRLIEGMEGEISVRSAPNQGSEFRVTLPFAYDPATAVLPGSQGPALVLSRQTLTRAAIGEMLELEGFQVHLAEPPEGPGTWQMATDDEALVLLDADLILSGATALRGLLEGAGRVILLVDLATFGEFAHLLGDPPTVEVLVKPCTPESLRRALHNLHRQRDQASQGRTSPAATRQEFLGAHILVAEDHPINQMVISDLLQHAGITVTMAGNGREALERLATDPTGPDLILMDVQMPELDGLEATHQLRASGATLPVIGLSAGSSTEEQARCQNAGMNDFLAKPIDLDALWGALTRWLPARPRATPPDPAPVPADLPATHAHTAAPLATAGVPTVITADAGAIDAGQDFPGLDLDDALPRFLGQRARLRASLQLFLETAPRVLADLRTAVAADDRRQAQRCAHSLKGTAGLFGAMRLLQAVRALEHSLAAGSGSQPGEHLIELQAALQELGAELT